MNCELRKYVDHSSIREQFRTTFLHCALLERKGIGMSTLGVICGGCCLRIAQLRDAKSDLLVRAVINPDDLKRNPDVIQEHLPESLREYNVALKRLGKSIADASAECGRCKPEPIGDRPVKAAAGTEMSQCSRQDWR